MLFVESSRMAGAGVLTLTGSLGDVMKESARAALTWTRAHARELGIDPDFYKTAEVHLHVPSGAIPKDGPSAGVTMTTALVSELTGRPVRGDVAMTGEITLSGKVLPIGGVKEKVLAARRVGIREVILPRQNEKNVNEDLSPELRKDMTIHLVSSIDEVLKLALTDNTNAPTPASRSCRRRIDAGPGSRVQGPGSRVRGPGPGPGSRSGVRGRPTDGIHPIRSLDLGPWTPDDSEKAEPRHRLQIRDFS